MIHGSCSASSMRAQAFVWADASNSKTSSNGAL
jgi:hypothetical protein